MKQNRRDLLLFFLIVFVFGTVNFIAIQESTIQESYASGSESCDSSGSCDEDPCEKYRKKVSEYETLVREAEKERDALEASGYADPIIKGAIVGGIGGSLGGPKSAAFGAAVGVSVAVYDHYQAPEAANQKVRDLAKTLSD